MGHFFEICTKIQVIAVEVTAVLGFLGALVVVLWIEWQRLRQFLSKFNT
jgi:hypothetical protein